MSARTEIVRKFSRAVLDRAAALGLNVQLLLEDGLDGRVLLYGSITTEPGTLFKKVQAFTRAHYEQNCNSVETTGSISSEQADAVTQTPPA